MDRDADAECKGPVVEHIDTVEHHRYDSPFLERHLRWRERVRRRGGELGRICRERDEQKLEKGDQESWYGPLVVVIDACLPEELRPCWEFIPLSGDDLGRVSVRRLS